MGRKWANIVAKKTAKDGATSKVYAKFGVEIYAAAKQGEPDPESNSALKSLLNVRNKHRFQNMLLIKLLIKPKVAEMKRSCKGVMKALDPMVQWLSLKR